MGIDNLGSATCNHCGSTIRMFTIFNRDMGGLARSWRNKHSLVCAKRTPKQRLKWAMSQLKKGESSAIEVNLDHEGFKGDE